jgi:hypothetical protein
LDARERIPTIAGEAGVRREAAKFFFRILGIKKPEPFGSGFGWLA